MRWFPAVVAALGLFLSLAPVATAQPADRTLGEFLAISDANCSLLRAGKLTLWGPRKAPETIDNHEMLVLHGVKRLTPREAATLANAPGVVTRLSLPDLQSLDSATANALFSNRAWRYLDLGSVRRIPADVVARFADTTSLRIGVESLDLETVTALQLSRDRWRDLGFSRLKSLSADVAAALTEVRSLDFEAIVDADLLPWDAIKGWRGELRLDGLTELEPGHARHLAGCLVVRLSLAGVTSVDTGTLRVILGNRRISALNLGIRELTPELATELSLFDGNRLHLDGATSLTPETAGALALWLGSELTLDGIETLDSATAAALAEWDTTPEDGILSLAGLHSLDDDAARKLAAWRGKTMRLNGLRRFPSRITYWRGNRLSLNGIQSLTEEEAHALVWDGSQSTEDVLHLDGLTSLELAAATQLSRWMGKRMSLASLETVSVEVAEALVGMSFTLHARQIRVPAADVAREVGRWRHYGGMRLSSVHELTPVIAAALATTSNLLSLPRVRSLDLPTAEALAKYIGDGLDLGGLTSMTAEVARVLAGWKGDYLRFGSGLSLDAAIGKALGASKANSLSFSSPTLNAETATGLTAFQGERIYFGARSVDVATLSALESFGGRVTFGELKEADDDALRIIQASDRITVWGMGERRGRLSEEPEGTTIAAWDLQPGQLTALQHSSRFRVVSETGSTSGLQMFTIARLQPDVVRQGQFRRGRVRVLQSGGKTYRRDLGQDGIEYQVTDAVPVDETVTVRSGGYRAVVLRAGGKRPQSDAFSEILCIDLPAVMRLVTAIGGRSWQPGDTLTVAHVELGRLSTPETGYSVRLSFQSESDGIATFAILATGNNGETQYYLTGRLLAGVDGRSFRIDVQHPTPRLAGVETMGLSLEMIDGQLSGPALPTEVDPGALLRISTAMGEQVALRRRDNNELVANGRLLRPGDTFELSGERFLVRKVSGDPRQVVVVDMMTEEEFVIGD